MNERLAAGALLLGAACFYWINRGRVEALSLDYSGQIGGVVDSVSSAANAASDYLEAIMPSANSMRTVSPALLDNPNVQAFMRVIRTGEGTADADGYRRIFGGQLFASYADHPRVYVKFGSTRTSAAGAYQFIASTWDMVRTAMSLPDFSPRSQDLACVGLIAYRRALDDVLAGRFDDAVRKCSLEWASLPGSPYGQPTISMTIARAVYAQAGGQVIA